MVEMYNRIMDKVRQELEAFEERIAQGGVDEKSIRALVRVVVGQEIAKIDSTISTLKAEIEELSKQGVSAETVRRLIDEIYNKLLSDLSSIVDKRIMHLVSIINEQAAGIKDVLDLADQLLRTETEFEEDLAKLRSEIRSMFSEERVEEALYKVLVKRGVIRQRKKWAPIIGLSVLASVVIGLIINPVLTFIVLGITIAVLLRW